MDVEPSCFIEHDLTFWLIPEPARSALHKSVKAGFPPMGLVPCLPVCDETKMHSSCSVARTMMLRYLMRAKHWQRRRKAK